MKIKINTDPETLFILHRIVLNECQMIATTRARRSGKSMRMELFTQLSQRCITYSSNPNGKKLTVTLKYHLASLLYDIIADVQYTLGIYEANKIEILKNDLHQKLL